ncbi:short-chain dehydrogenase [Diplonema papillatum]|nr:short-chain dehydrogenase [Diplonema papillatum]
MSKTAVVIGAGPGVGAATCRHLLKEGFTVWAVRRSSAEQVSDGVWQRASEDTNDEQLAEIKQRLIPKSCDCRNEEDVEALFDAVSSACGGAPDLCVINIGANVRFSLLETTARVYRKVWEMATFSAFLTAKAAARRMVKMKKGTILFTSATASKRGDSGFSAFSGALFAKRALAQSMTAEFAPQGVHVAHVIIDGPIDTPFAREMLKIPPGHDPRLVRPTSVAKLILVVHEQTPDCWLHEVDMRANRTIPWWSSL